jgi:hypothetical protein
VAERLLCGSTSSAFDISENSDDVSEVMQTAIDVDGSSLTVAVVKDDILERNTSWEAHDGEV